MSLYHPLPRHRSNLDPGPRLHEGLRTWIAARQTGVSFSRLHWTPEELNKGPFKGSWPILVQYLQPSRDYQSRQPREVCRSGWRSLRIVVSLVCQTVKQSTKDMIHSATIELVCAWVCQVRNRGT